MKTIPFCISSCIFILLSHISVGQGAVELRTDGIIIPKITNAQRPGTPVLGHLVYNMDQDQFEYYNGTLWAKMGGDSNSLIDMDGDSKIEFGENFTPLDPDQIIFRTDGTSTFTIEKTSGGDTRIKYPTTNKNIGINSGLRATSTAINNIAIGSSALRLNEAAYGNIAIGDDALKNMNTQEGQTQFGGRNVAIGHKALENADGFSGQNTVVGYQAGLDGGSQSVMLGYEAGKTGGLRSVFLGFEAGKDASNLNKVLFINNTSGDDALIYGNFDEGKVVINSNGGVVEDAFLINASSVEHGPMRIKIDNATKFRVHNNGGLSIGTHAAPFDNGLKVANLDEAGPPTPLFADDRGNVTRRSGMQYTSIGSMNFEDVEGTDSSISYEKFADRIRLIGGPKTVYAPVSLPHGVTIQEFRGWVNLSHTPPPGKTEGLESRIRLVAAHYTPQASLQTKLAEFISSGYPSEARDNEEIIFADNIGHVVDNINYHYFIEAYDNRSSNESVEYGLLKFTIGYEY